MPREPKGCAQEGRQLRQPMSTHAHKAGHSHLEIPLAFVHHLPSQASVSSLHWAGTTILQVPRLDNSWWVVMTVPLPHALQLSSAEDSFCRFFSNLYFLVYSYHHHSSAGLYHHQPHLSSSGPHSPTVVSGSASCSIVCIYNLNL